MGNAIDDPSSAPAQNHMANPARFSRTPVTYRHRAPQLDQDRAAVLEMLRSRGSG